jgi:hypothetical protein
MKTNAIHQNRSAQIGRAGGMIWLISITFIFALLDLYFAKLPMLLTIGTGTLIFIITGVFLTWSINTLSLARKLPDEKSEEGIQKGRYIRRWFLIILILEIAGLNIVTITLLSLHCFQYIVPANILIIALHFIPLGRIFTMPVYYFLGIIVSLITILTVVFVPASLKIGNLIAVIIIPSLSFIFLNWIMIGYILQDGMKYLKKT